jgi:regulatory protein
VRTPVCGHSALAATGFNRLAVAFLRRKIVAGIITALEQQVNNKERLNVFMDGEFAFGLSRKVAHELEIGQRLSEKEISSLQVRDAEEVHYERVLRLFSRRPRSEQEIRRYLERRDVGLQAQEAIIQRLYEAQLLDDHAFARAWVENRDTFRPRGSFALKMELREKGIDAGIISEVLSDHDDERAAYKAARKAARRWQGSEPDSFRKRVGAYLARRGFRYETINPVVSQVWRETTKDGEESEVPK